jgi:hypothetical protein
MPPTPLGAHVVKFNQDGTIGIEATHPEGKHILWGAVHYSAEPKPGHWSQIPRA